MNRSLICGLLGLLVGGACGAEVVWSVLRNTANQAGTPVPVAAPPAKTPEGQLELRLPDPSNAKPVETATDTVIFFNVNDKGEVVVPGREPVRDAMEIEEFIKQEAQAARNGEPEARVRVVLRAHPESKFKDVVRVVELCIKADLRDIQLRSVVASDR